VKWSMTVACLFSGGVVGEKTCILKLLLRGRSSLLLRETARDISALDRIPDRLPSETTSDSLCEMLKDTELD